jgi:hypothetical protein
MPKTRVQEELFAFPGNIRPLAEFIASAYEFSEAKGQTVKQLLVESSQFSRKGRAY